MRTDDSADTIRSAQLAVRYRDEGVIGFDLAGAERYFPPSDHAESIEIARDGGLGITCHAGESDSGDRVLEAAGLGATRIGHGIHIVRGETPTQTREWVEVARGMGLHFEVCPSSNVHTGAVKSLEEHPIWDMLVSGLSVSCSTDNRLMSGVTLTSELEALRDAHRLHQPRARAPDARRGRRIVPARRRAQRRDGGDGTRLGRGGLTPRVLPTPAPAMAPGGLARRRQDLGPAWIGGGPGRRR